MKEGTAIRSIHPLKLNKQSNNFTQYIYMDNIVTDRSNLLPSSHRLASVVLDVDIIPRDQITSTEELRKTKPD